MGATSRTRRVLSTKADMTRAKRRIAVLEGDVRELVDIARRNRLATHPGIITIANRHKLSLEP